MDFQQTHNLMKKLALSELKTAHFKAFFLGVILESLYFTALGQLHSPKAEHISPQGQNLVKYGSHREVSIIWLYDSAE